MSRLRIALLGAGNIARTHIDRIARSAHCELAAIADPSPAAEGLATSLNVPWYRDHRALLDAQTVHGAIVAAPNALHVPLALDCISRGVAPLVEKPVADSVGQARALAEAQRTSGVPVLVGQHRRHNPINRRAREIVQSGRLGRIVTVNAMATFLKPDAYFEAAWRREKGGGPILINLIHDMDQLRFIVGEVDSVQAVASHAVRGYEVEDTVAIIVRFTGGALGTITLSDSVTSPWCWDFCAGEQDIYPQQSVQSHFIGGTHGSISLPDLTLWHYSGPRGWYDELTREQRSVHRMDPYTLQLEHFLAVIERREAPLCDALDGLKTMQATLAVAQAAREGGSVSLADAHTD